MTTPTPPDSDLKALVKLADTAIRSFGEPLAKFVGETLGEPIKNAIGVVVSDPLAFYRLERIAERMQRTKEKLEERSIRSVQPIPPKLAVGILEGASLEEEPDLQELWDTLMTNALDPEFQQRIPPAFITVLKELSPVDAVLLKCLVDYIWKYDQSDELSLRIHTISMREVLKYGSSELRRFESRDLILAFQNLDRLHLIRLQSERWYTTETEYVESILFTLDPLGMAFAFAVFESPNAMSGIDGEPSESSDVETKKVKS